MQYLFLFVVIKWPPSNSLILSLKPSILAENKQSIYFFFNLNLTIVYEWDKMMRETESWYCKYPSMKNADGWIKGVQWMNALKNGVNHDYESWK